MHSNFNSFISLGQINRKECGMMVHWFNRYIIGSTIGLIIKLFLSIHKLGIQFKHKYVYNKD